ncbi:MAG: hypothetical protein GY769_02435 [bacterium]|nr:hypothetical protein [bacterium]
MRNAILSPLRHPLLWLVLLFWTVWRNLIKTGFLVAVPSPDTLSYDLLSRSDSLSELLSSVRTIGYPLFLKLLRSVSPDYQAAPTVHLAIYLAVVVLFWWSVRGYTGSPWRAFAWSLPLAYPCNLAFIKFIQPDFLGPAVAIAVTALLIMLARRPTSPILWILLTVVTFCSYQVRPDNLFLVVLVPLGGVVLLLCRRTFDTKRLLRVGAGLIAVTVVPLLLFMTLRWGLVGQFGVVPFGGYNLVGVAASFLDDELVRDLPPEQQELAAAILRGRRALKYQRYKAAAWTRNWHPQYSPNVWRVAEPIARELLTDAETTRFKGVDVPPVSGDAVFTINRAFKELSRAIILRRPILYCKWVYDGLWTGLAMLPQCMSFVQLMTLLVLSVPALLIRARRVGGNDSASTIDRVLRLHGISIVVVAYFLGKLLLTVLVSVPYDRYVFPSMAFLPCVLAAALFEAWHWVLSAQENN